LGPKGKTKAKINAVIIHKKKRKKEIEKEKS